MSQPRVPHDGAGEAPMWEKEYKEPWGAPRGVASVLIILTCANSHARFVLEANSHERFTHSNVNAGSMRKQPHREQDGTAIGVPCNGWQAQRGGQGWSVHSGLTGWWWCGLGLAVGWSCQDFWLWYSVHVHVCLTKLPCST